MKYFIIAGEASGDLHASHLISALRRVDPDAQFRFLGGDMMADAAAVAPIVHYRDMAYMGFIEVAKHLPTILGFMRTAKREIATWKPDVVIPVDYPSFNLKVAKYAHSLGIAVHYFISPKVWVWKKWRVRDIKRYVSAMYCILPFEPEFYRAYDYEATYVGNPTVSEIAQAMRTFDTREDFAAACGMDPSRPLIAIVPGSPEITALSAQNGEIRLSVSDLSDTGVDGYEAQYRMKGSAEWGSAPFAHGRTDLVISGLAAGEYEVQVCAFVDNTAASAPEELQTVACGSYGEPASVTVP